jgi:hypothetical protein
MTDAPRARTRFARLWPDGGMSVEPAGMDFAEARERMRVAGDDDDVELLEIEITVIRTHGSPHVKAVGEHHATCPCCGEIVTIEVPA